jgi:hypothetical protein
LSLIEWLSPAWRAKKLTMSFVFALLAIGDGLIFRDMIEPPRSECPASLYGVDEPKSEPTGGKPQIARNTRNNPKPLERIIAGT